MTLPAYLSRQEIEQQVTLALAEDIGQGDLTAALIPDNETSSATILCRDDAVICGINWVNEVFHQLDSTIAIDWQVNDGDRVYANTVLANISGNSRQLLTGERTALNFLQTLSGVATQTASYVKAVERTGVKLLDTRKTLPGLRKALKYAVLCGGGHNHRVGLYDAILIKENHIMAAGSITSAVKQAQALNSNVMIEVETENLDEVREALNVGANRIMLDNMDNATMREAVSIVNGGAELEASGGVGKDALRAIAETGVDYISIGSLTKHVRAIDLSMRFQH
ncbi:MAG: carboxylating nicotinate-nucleotide diphosphorylase [Gammaproteobacteria bacterium]|nr:carboxylating nicotinate-nucleotide diphosphorylase [Gammaproteobacteria bacterium]